MATLAQRPRTHGLAADAYEKCLSVAAVILLACILVAMAKSQGDVFRLNLNIVGHLSTVIVALVLTPVMLLRPRGDRWHRRLGWLWVAAMILTALISLDMRYVNHGGFSFIHILSVFTLVQVPLIVWSAQKHDVRRHRSRVRAMVTGALLIAGFFTFPFDRLLGHWLFS